MKKFKKIYVEITNVCNLHCRFCPKNSRPSEYMSVESFERILKEIKPYCSSIYLHVKGEPLLHPHFAQLLKIAEINGFKTNITTNGTLIGKNGSAILNAQTVRQVNISLHSLTEHSQQMDHQAYLTHLADFIYKAVHQSQIYISLRFWNIKHDNTSQNLFYHSLLKDLLAPINLSVPTIDFENSGKSTKITDRLFVHIENEFDWPNLQSPNLETKGYCLGLRDQIAILTCGTVVPCCLDADGIISLGNIFQTSLGQILSSDKAKHIYQGFSRGEAVEELCKKCTFKKRFDHKVS